MIQESLQRCHFLASISEDEVLDISKIKTADEDIIENIEAFSLEDATNSEYYLQKGGRLGDAVRCGETHRIGGLSGRNFFTLFSSSHRFSFTFFVFLITNPPKTVEPFDI